MPNETLAERFASWVTSLDGDSIPPETEAAGRRAIIDTLGVIAAGSAHPSVQQLCSAYRSIDGACLAADGRSLDAITAALVNGMSAHVWDYDDNSYTGMVHGSAIILPAVLAAGAETNASDAELLLAFIVGSEITYTLGEVVGHTHFLQGWWATGSLALIGAVAAVCRLHTASKDMTAHAIGTAAVSAGIERALNGTDAKPYLCGHVAARALMISQAAQAGLSGPRDGFEHKNGFFARLNNGVADLSQVASLGKRWRLVSPGLQCKTSPVCSAAHAGIELIAELLAKAGKTAADLKSVHAEVPRLVRESLIYDAPKTSQEAQFSLPFCLASAALNGRLSLEHLNEGAIQAEEIIDLMQRIRISIAEDLSEPPQSSRYPESTRLTLSFYDGNAISGFCGEPYGMPERPLSDEDLYAKYRSCLQFCGKPTIHAPETASIWDLVRQSLGAEQTSNHITFHSTAIRSVQ